MRAIIGWLSQVVVVSLLNLRTIRQRVTSSLMELLLSEEEVPVDLIHAVVRNAVQCQDVTAVFVGSAYKNKGVQPLLDAVCRYLPSPLDREVKAKAWDNPEEVFKLEADSSKPFVAMAFKIVDDSYGQLTFLRIYQGQVEKGQTYCNQRTGRKDRFSRIVRMHADHREEIDSASAGDIVAIMGLDCASGDTYAATPKMCALESMFVPDPVIKVSVNTLNRGESDKLSKALQRFRKEDPTFRVLMTRSPSERV